MKNRMLAATTAVLLLVGMLLGCSAKPEEPGASSRVPDTAELDKLVEDNKLLNLLGDNSIVYSQLDLVAANVWRAVYYLENGELRELSWYNDELRYADGSMKLKISDDGVTAEISAEKSSSMTLSETTFFDLTGASDTTAIDEGDQLNYVTRSLMDEALVEEYSSLWKCQVGDYMVSSQTVDKDANLVGSMDFYIESADGSRREYIAKAVIANGERPTIPTALSALLEGDLHTVTVNLSDGSVRKVSLPASAVVTCITDEGEALYSDEDGAVPYAFPAAPLTGDVTVYCK